MKRFGKGQDTTFVLPLMLLCVYSHSRVLYCTYESSDELAFLMCSSTSVISKVARLITRAFLSRPNHASSFFPSYCDFAKSSRSSSVSSRIFYHRSLIYSFSVPVKILCYPGPLAWNPWMQPWLLHWVRNPHPQTRTSCCSMLL